MSYVFIDVYKYIYIQFWNRIDMVTIKDINKSKAKNHI